MTPSGDGLSDAQLLGQEAAELKWHRGWTWTEVYDRWPDEDPQRVRSTARRWKEAHPKDFPQAETPFEEHPEDIGVEFEEEGNEAEARSLSTQITSLAELLDACDVDTDVWEVEHHTIRTYDGWRGDVHKDLTFEEGKISGFVRDGGIITKTLYSIYAKLVRRKPIELQATFKLLRSSVDYPTPPESAPGHQVRALLFSDVHLGFRKDLRNGKLKPFHDRRMLDVICRIASDYDPNLIGILGDLFDLTRWTRRYAHEPEFFWSTAPALNEGHWLLRRLRNMLPRARIIFVEGNHEVRLPCYVRDHMIEASGLTRIAQRFPALSLPNLLDLDALKVKWIDGYEDDRATFKPVPWMVWEHGNIARTTGNTAKAIVEKSVRWRFSGHTHRCEIASRSFEEDPDDPRPPVSSVQFGCCCHTDGRAPGASPDSQWQKRFGLVEFDKREPPPTVEIIPVRNGVARWRGRVYRGRDYAEELRAVWPEWNW